jgi:hypothetical protein
MRDPRDERDDDDELENAAQPEGEHEQEPRLALSDEIARRWDPSMISKAVARRGSAGQPLDALTRARYERQLGVDLGEVRIHTGPFAEHITRQHTAEAVTVGGTGMIFMRGTPDRSPATASGQALLAHELTHVAQQSRHAGGGLHRKATQDMPFTEEHEAEAEAVEAEEGQGASRAAADEGSARLRAEEDRERKLEEIRDRVLEMAADEARTQYARTGIRRRT